MGIMTMSCSGREKYSKSDRMVTDETYTVTNWADIYHALKYFVPSNIVLVLVMASSDILTGEAFLKRQTNHLRQ